MTAHLYSGLDFDLAIGEVYGLRTWLMDDYGRLQAMHIRMAQPWRPGVNEAVCHASEYGVVTLGTTLAQIAAGGLVGPGGCRCPSCAPRAAAEPEAHPTPAEQCKCGFYAYTSPATRETYTGQDGYILGVVRGTGRTLIGTKGFRCEKAEIVALLDPRGDHPAGSGFAWQADRLRAVYPDVPLLPSRDQLIAFAPIESAAAVPSPTTDEFWSLP
jgi:hypothetical protein